MPGRSARGSPLASRRLEAFAEIRRVDKDLEQLAACDSRGEKEKLLGERMERHRGRLKLMVEPRGAPPAPLATCAGASPAVGNGDANGDAAVDVSDAIGLLGWIFLGGAFPVLACASDGQPGVFLGGARSNPRVVPPEARAYGETDADRGVELGRWLLATPADANPLFGGDGATDRSGRVGFIVHTADGSTRSCTVPAGKSVSLPLLADLDDLIRAAEKHLSSPPPPSYNHRQRRAAGRPPCGSSQSNFQASEAKGRTSTVFLSDLSARAVFAGICRRLAIASRE